MLTIWKSSAVSRSTEAANWAFSAKAILNHVVVDVVAGQMAGGFDGGDARAISAELGDMRAFMEQHACHHRLETKRIVADLGGAPDAGRRHDEEGATALGAGEGRHARGHCLPVRKRDLAAVG
ncbi:MAG: hypothetical protein IT547_12035, partial [Hyphomonadaceae bacterium]|nr:hypothetical protein [Hyphomonadaceae bacterium]